MSFLFGCYSCKGQKRKLFFFHTSPWLPLYGSSDGPELIEPSRARTFTRCFMSSTNVVALKGPGEGALRGHPDRKSPRSHSNFVTFHMHSICRRRKAFCLGPINTLATSVTTPQTPPPQIGIRPWLWADALNLQRAAVGAVRSCKELLLRYAEDSSDPLQMFPALSQDIWVNPVALAGISAEMIRSQSVAMTRTLAAFAQSSSFFLFSFHNYDVSHLRFSVKDEMYYPRQLDESPWWEST